ncbi:DUF4157 domain-containing protein [Sinorhizobium medicae]|nr:DUF4157 domain-containing protein [Sinorhizobium medicae]MDX0469420.1 DUF4157 domain-containing protein [Sinorhizobium medicae]MDX0475743.1 DUF4157 domain-containing protein [Sinorhizobium medicae]MDX0900935.1 DUF4157 domain-containing protein [Sinorhizobium medicae]MDX1176546.1 DUF4157 domain-containing protein [Sinorhizobium medicae]
MRVRQAARLIAVLLGVLLSFASVSRAGGLLGDAINTIAPGAGTALDDAHRQIKEAVPPYKAIEEGTTQAVNEALVQAGAPALQELIARSRDDALASGVEPIPQNIRENLQGFIPDQILNVARYRVRGGGDLTLQVNAIRYGEAQAIALDYVIVFKEQNDALYNPVLWAHELTHVKQYQDWGIGDFAIRYLRSHHEVEREAYEAETRYMAWAAVRNSGSSTNDPSINRPVDSFSGAGTSNVCGSWMGQCQLAGSAPVGTPCWCNTAVGPSAGALVPTSTASMPTIPAGFPPGFVMRGCGCWGPNPAPIANEPQCQNQQVQVNVCPMMCAPGHPSYGYVCR